MTQIHKSHHGWRAQTTIDLDAGLVLNFVTLKRSNGTLATTVQCGKSDGGFFSYVMFQDYSEGIIFERPARVTEKVVADQHRRALEQLDGIKARCAAYYAQRSAKTTDA